MVAFSRPLPVLLALLLGAGATGCGDDHGFVVAEHLVVEDCGEDGGAREFAPFRLDLTTFGVDPGKGPLFIRAQREGEPLTGGDGFLVSLDDGDAFREWLRDHPNTPLSFGADAPPGSGAPTVVRGSLLLAQTCPDSYQPIEVAGGTIVFEELGTENGDRVALRFDGTSLRDLRTGAVVGTGFSGEMDFEVRTSRPYRWHNP